MIESNKIDINWLTNVFYFTYLGTYIKRLRLGKTVQTTFRAINKGLVVGEGSGERCVCLENEGLGGCIVAVSMLLGQLLLNDNGRQVGGSWRGWGSCGGPAGGSGGWWRRQIGRSRRGCRCCCRRGGGSWWWRRQIGGHRCWSACGGRCGCCCRGWWWRWQVGGHWCRWWRWQVSGRWCGCWRRCCCRSCAGNHKWYNRFGVIVAISMLLSVMVVLVVMVSLGMMLRQQLRRQVRDISCGQSQHASGKDKAKECVLQVKEKGIRVKYKYIYRSREQ